jgi:CubicO group peptidase (beta-lactamase class C family)
MLLKQPVHPITVRNLLTHTSGLAPMSPIERQFDPVRIHIDVLPLRTAVITYAMSPLKFQPGGKYQYSNAGINTAGRIIEVVSGMPYEQFMATRLFEPLGMIDTTFWPSAKQLARLAKSYKPQGKSAGLEEMTIHMLTYPLDGPHRYPCPAGGLFSTAVDVSRFCRMILQGGSYQGKRYLSEATVRQMTSTQTGALHVGAAGYGFGWTVWHETDSKTGIQHDVKFGHGGAYLTDMQIDPQQQLITVFMVQRNGFDKQGHMILETFRKAAMDAFAKKTN